MNSKQIGGAVALVIVAVGAWFIWKKYGNPFSSKKTASGPTQAQALAYVNSLPTFDVSRAFGPLNLQRMPWIESYVDSTGRVQ